MNKKLKASADFAHRAAAALRQRPLLSVIAMTCIAVSLLWSPRETLEDAPAALSPTARIVASDQHDALSTAQAPDPEALASVPVTELANASANSLPQSDHSVEDAAWTQVAVQPGQSMGVIFNRLGLSPAVLHQIVNLDERTARLTRIQPGDEFDFHFNDDGDLLALRTAQGDAHWLVVERNGDEGFKSRLEARQLEYRQVEVSATITSNLFNAAKQAGMSDNMTMRLANIFGWDIDFALDIRAGDRFALVYQELWRDGEFVRDDVILAARFDHRGQRFEAIRFDAGNGPDYFSPDGRPMRKAFLRAPLNFTRVTSNFNPQRFHPITRQVRPHNGTDYGAATGTPVWAAGDGRVIRSAFNNVNGHYIFIQHGNNIVTRYLHLSRRDVREGQRVRQGQTIGAVGATGLATGPHLHYEFLVNGVHRNPRTVDLPDADPLPATQLANFQRHGELLLARLDQFDEQARLLAAAETAGCDSGSSC